MASRTIRSRGSFRTRPHLESLELFAGAGGLALGLKRAGFKPGLVVEWDEVACETLRANKKLPRTYTRGWPIEQVDVRSLSYLDLDTPDLLSAGTPCQPFSNGGHGRGERDNRNLFDEVLRAVRQLRPRAFLIENVRGLLFDRYQSYFEHLIAQLRVPTIHRASFRNRRSHLAALRRAKHKHYVVKWKLLNAADFGLPQNRVRLVIVGLHVDEEAKWSWPEPTHTREALIRALHDDEYWDLHGVSRRTRKRVQETLPPRPKRASGQRWRTLRDLVAQLGEPNTNGTGDSAHALVPGARLYAKHTGSSLDWPAKTVKAGVNGSPGGEHILLADNGSHRYLSVRECASLQGFPEDYALPELRSQAMRQIGNAVPVDLAEAVGKRFAEVLRNGKS